MENDEPGAKASLHARIFRRSSWRCSPRADVARQKFALDYSNFEKRFEKLDNWQITSGVDQLYEADFRNLTISLADAVWLVSMAAIGEPTERIQAQLAELRKVYAPR